MGDETTNERPAGGPVAAVVVETPLAHLDRVFEYTVPEEMSADAVPGARVRVRFAGRDLEGFVVERRPRPEHDGRLSPLRRVVSPEPVLTPEVLRLARAVADRYAGTLSDVLRLAVPKRHATAERNLPLEPPASQPAQDEMPHGPTEPAAAGQTEVAENAAGTVDSDAAKPPEQDESPTGAGRSVAAAEPGQDESPSGAGRSVAAVEPEQDENSTGAGRSAAAVEPEQDENPAGAGRSAAAVEPEQDENPAGADGSVAAVEPEQDENPAGAGRSVAAVEPEQDENPAGAGRSVAAVEPEQDANPGREPEQGGNSSGAGSSVAAGEPESLGPWAAYPAGPAFLRRVTAGQAPAAAWSALPTRRRDDDWPRAFALAAAAALAGGRGAVLVVPDHRDVTRLDRALTDVLGPGRHVRLTADQGPQARYTAWLKVLRGHVRVVIGTRAAAFAPVHDLGLVAWWDDGDDLLAEPRAPYHHTGVVLGIRAQQSNAALLTGGFVRSLRTQVEIEAGRLFPVEADPATARAVMPRVSVAGEGLDEERDGASSRAHLPSRAWRVAKDALVDGPVLVQVPRRGYLPSLSCAECRTPVRCPRCSGPMALGSSGAPPSCRWCGMAMVATGFECASCGSNRLRSSVTGARRTAEEIGRAFPGVPVHTSGSGEVLAEVGSEPSLVIATPGAEPVADGGYTAVLLLDAWASLDLPVLDAPLESLRRWASAGALARAGRAVVLCGVPDVVALPAVEALVRWDPAWLAERELAERRELGLPPAARFAQLTGARRALDDALTQLDLPDGAAVLGPMPVTPGRGPRSAESGGADRHALLRIDAGRTPELTQALRALRAFRSARKESEVVTVRVDPLESW